jgi:TonB family protein
MASIETPPNTEHQQSPNPRPNQANGLRTPALPDMSAEEFHFLISELRDENSRSRWREAIWISIIVHLLLLFTIREAPKLWPTRQVTLVESPDILKNRQLTYLDSPPDLQKLTRKPDTDKMSDKNRIATAKNPRVDKKLLDELRDNRRSGPPGQNAAQQAPPQVAQQQPQGQPNAQQQAQQQQQQQQRDLQNALETPPQAKPNFGNFRMGSPSVGEAIAEAARATAPSRGRGMAGDYGNGLAASNSPHKSDIDVLSDTMGVDFAPYLQRVLHDVRVNWYNLIPEVARAPLLKQGRVAIEFQIGKNGAVEGMHLVGPSGDISLDRAAWGGITGSNPFPPLPSEFHGQNIALRFHFYYNPDRGSELR